MPSRSGQSTRRIVVALDGPASSGKSSVGAAAAEQLGLRFVDTGLFYRALTALALLEGVDLEDPAVLVPLVDRVSLGDDGSGRFTRVLLDGSDATEEARSAIVDGAVSTVARIPEVRAALLERQRDLAADGGIVMAGRDVGTVVLPDADLKLFLDASVEERAQRRIEERGLDPDGAEAEEVREQLRARDAIDTGREVAPLRAADDAVHVLTDGNAFDETVEIVAAEIAGVMLTPRPRTRTRTAPAAAAVPEQAVIGGEAAETPEHEPTPKAKRTRAPKAAAAAASAAAKPKRTRTPKAAPEPAAGPEPEAAAAAEPEPEGAPTTEDQTASAAEPQPVPRLEPEPATEPEPAPAAERAPEPEPEPTLQGEPTPESEAAAQVAPLSAPTRRAQARARSTARRAALAAATTEPADSTSQSDESADVGQASSREDDIGHDQGVDAADFGRDSYLADEIGASESALSHPEGEGADAGLEPSPKPRHTPTRRAQARARATARRAALAAGAATGEAPEAASEQEAEATEGEQQPTAKTAHTPTKRSQARARSTARRAALAAAATAATLDDEAIAESEPEPERAAGAKPAHTPTKRSQARSRATARRAALAAAAASDPDSSTASEAGPKPAPEAIAEPEAERELKSKAAHTPTKRSQARARATARRAELAAAAQPEPEAAPESQPEPGAVPEPKPEFEPAVAPVAAASAPAAQPRARPAAKPRERDAILEAAMNLDNDQSMVVRMTALIARIGSRLVADVDVQGLEHVPRRGPVILAVNHISNADPVVVGAWITDALRRRRIHWLGKRELFTWPVVGWLAAHGGIHPVDRDSADIEAFRLATKILDNGYVLLVFPEGTRSPTGELQEAKDGVAMLALRTGAPIVPVGVNNTDAVWRKGRKLPLPFPRRRVTVRIGIPFRVQDVIPEDVGRREAKGLATTVIMGRIAALLDPRHRGVYAGAVPEDRPPRR